MIVPTALEITMGCLKEALQLPDELSLTDETLIFGEMPEFDSMGVVAVLACFEENHGITYDDDEVNVELFTSVKTLAESVSKKLGN